MFVEMKGPKVVNGHNQGHSLALGVVFPCPRAASCRYQGHVVQHCSCLSVQQLLTGSHQGTADGDLVARLKDTHTCSSSSAFQPQLLASLSMSPLALVSSKPEVFPSLQKSRSNPLMMQSPALVQSSPHRSQVADRDP